MRMALTGDQIVSKLRTAILNAKTQKEERKMPSIKITKYSIFDTDLEFIVEVPVAGQENIVSTMKVTMPTSMFREILADFME